MNKTKETILKLIYNLPDTDIEELLHALHQDLGREGFLYCEVCNDKEVNL